MWMVPIYAIESWLSLRFKQFAFTLALFRDSYEAYVIYCFCYLLIALLGTENEVNEIIKGKTEHDLEHMFPFKCMFNRFEKYEFLTKVKRGVLQYVVVKIVCTIITLITSNIVIDAATDETLYDQIHMILYISFICCDISQLLANMGNVLFSIILPCMHEKISSYRPFGKFVCVKQLSSSVFGRNGNWHGCSFWNYTWYDESIFIIYTTRCCKRFARFLNMYRNVHCGHCAPFAFHYRDFTIKC